MVYTEMIVFIVYFLFMLGIGLVFFFKSKGGGEKDYFLGGRKMGPWVSALSAGAYYQNFHPVSSCHVTCFFN